MYNCIWTRRFFVVYIRLKWYEIRNVAIQKPIRHNASQQSHYLWLVAFTSECIILAALSKHVWKKYNCSYFQHDILNFNLENGLEIPLYH